MTARPKTVVSMQPYFVPYAGYFRLFAATDVFILSDDVQFTRSGWIHRNRLPNQNGDLRWLGLPLARAPVWTKIKDMVFREDAREALMIQLPRFSATADIMQRDPELGAALLDLSGSPMDTIETLLRIACRRMDIGFPAVRASTLRIDPELTGLARLMAKIKLVGGGRYVNAPGGVALYDPRDFEREGIELVFLDPFEGSKASILHRLVHEDPHRIGEEIRRQLPR